MPNARAATLIQERLPYGLPHPGDPANNQKPFVITLPGMRSTGIPPEMADQFAHAAGLPTHDTPKLLAEALVNLLEIDGGFTIIDNAELAQLRQDAADAPDGTRVINLCCRRHSGVVLQLTIGKADHVDVDCRHLAQALEHHKAA